MVYLPRGYLLLDRGKITEVIFDALKELNEELPAEESIALEIETKLMGAGSTIDSLSLVSLVSSVETALNSDYELDICLVDDRAMSQPISPFTSVQSLSDYISDLLNEQSGK